LVRQNKCKRDAKEVTEGRDIELQKTPEIDGVGTHTYVVHCVIHKVDIG
jgi:hypothetical protein